MSDLPIKANVECTDGPCGKSTNVIINPVNHSITHIVVKDDSLPQNATRLVPVGKIVSIAGQQIKLSCSKADVANMLPFMVTNFIQESASGKAYESGTAYTSQYVLNDTAYDSVKEENIPAGEMELHSGMGVEATDGKLGKLDELVLDPKSGEITHLLMREGHLWSKKDIAIPVSAVDFSDGKSVYLKLDKMAVKDLPAVAVKRP